MAEDSLAPRGRAATVSRRALLSGIATAPIAGSVRGGIEPIDWDHAVHAYATAHYAYETFLATTLRPAYRRFDADLAATRGSAQGADAGANLRDAEMAVREAEGRVVDAGGDRAAIVALRATHPGHAAARQRIAHSLLDRRARGHLMRRHRVYELEDRGNDLASVKGTALFQVIAIPAPNREGALLKMRLAYEEILRPEDHDGVVRMIFADIERLWQ
jgi:hypothetical protein